MSLYRLLNTQKKFPLSKFCSISCFFTSTHFKSFSHTEKIRRKSNSFIIYSLFSGSGGKEVINKYSATAHKNLQDSIVEVAAAFSVSLFKVIYDI